MAHPTETWVATEPIDAESWQALAARMMDSAGWREEVFVYTESLDDCTIDQCEARKALDHITRFARSDVASLLEGRIFDSSVEARWRRLKDGKWAAWIVRELANTPEAANHSLSGYPREARRTIRRYYLLGTRDKTANDFHEARYAKRFKYPLPKHRAYIEVAEYRRVEPTWSELSATGDAGIEPINEALAQPLLFAHRFVNVDAGIDHPKEG